MMPSRIEALLNRPKVVVLQRRLAHYRVPFFEALKRELEARRIDLVLVFGQPTALEQAKRDQGQVPWGIGVSNFYFHWFGRNFSWQPIPPEATGATLLVITQESSIISNYRHILGRRCGGPKVAYWGHGRNFQSGAPAGWAEHWKRILLKQVDWWFAYTSVTVECLKRSRFPLERVTCVNNAIDTRSFRQQLSAVSDSDLAALRQRYDLSEDAEVGLFCGSLYSEKRLDLLLRAAALVHRERPRFVLTIIGDGPDYGWLQSEVAAMPWVKILGAVQGQRKAAWFRYADVLLNPGLVGLVILDAFAAGMPLITTSTAHHSPEIAYLRNGENGLLVSDTPDAYAAAIVSVFSDPELRQKLGTHALAVSNELSIENMAKNFADGVSQCLAS